MMTVTTHGLNGAKYLRNTKKISHTQLRIRVFRSYTYDMGMPGHSTSSFLYFRFLRG